MISTGEVVERSLEIAQIRKELTILDEEYAECNKKLNGIIDKTKQLLNKQTELAADLIKACNQPLTIDDLDE